METVLTYLLSAQKKSKFVVFSQNGQSYGRQNTIGTYSDFKSQLPCTYKQAEFPKQVVAAGRQFTLVGSDKNVLLYQTAEVSSKRGTLAVLFADEFQAYLAVGFNDSAVNFNYAQMVQQMRQEFEVRDGFQLSAGSGQQELDLADNNFSGQRSVRLFGLELKYIQKVYAKQRQQFTLVCFLDPENADFEYLIQQVACLQDRMPFVFFVLVLKDLIVYDVKSKKIDPLEEALKQFRKISQRCKYIGRLNVVSDYARLLDEALKDLPFVYQLFDLQDQRSKDELGCLTEQVEDDVRQLIAVNEEAQQNEFQLQKQRYLVDIQFDKMTDINEKKRVLQELEKTNNERTSVRKNFYYISHYSELDHDIIIKQGKATFSGMEISIMRQPTQYCDDKHICLAFCEQDNIEQVCGDLQSLSETDYYIILLIKGVWQFNLRKLLNQYSDLQNFCILADEFGIYNKISQTCGQTLSFIKFRGERIQKVVATVSELDDTDQEKDKIRQLEKKLQEDAREEEQLKHIQYIFSTYDVNNDGVISQDEAINQVLADLPEGADVDAETEKVRELMELVDYNQDGVMQFNEFEDFARICGLGMK